MLYRTLAMFPSEDLNRTAEFYEQKMTTFMKMHAFVGIIRMSNLMFQNS